MLSPEKSNSPRRNDSWLSVWPGVCQTSSFSEPTVMHVAVVDQVFNLDRRHFQVDVLGFDFGERLQPIARLQRPGRQRMGRDIGAQKLLGLRQPLNVVDVGVGGDERFALRKREVELADQLHNLVHCLVIADVDQQPLLGVVNHVNITSQHLPRLKIRLDHMRENGLANEHGSAEWEVRSAQWKRPMGLVEILVRRRRSNNHGERPVPAG